MTSDDHQRVSEEMAKRVLARAVQLDESDRMSVRIADLRTAADEAGISSSALEQALSEIATPQPAEPHLPVHSRRAWRIAAIVAVVIALLGATLMFRAVPRSEPTEPTIQLPENP
ncbi:MAG TPA: hypothetical protein VFZ69_06200 [Longimicrobiales bacterium]